jgi:glycosyltransferase involved in cell wall biosynthesis
VRFIVIGSNTTERILKLKNNSIVVKGFLRDFSSYFQDAKVFVAPLRYGAGFKGKIVQAMSYGLPVVTTSNRS